MRFLSDAVRTTMPRTAVLAAAGVLLVGCSSASSSSTPTSAAPSESTSSSPSASAPAAQTVAMGATVTLPTDTVTVSSFTDKASPKATKPTEAGTHWASAAVKQCATAASRQGTWELALKGGGTAPEPTSWTEGELDNQLQPSDEAFASGDCVSGNVYFVMPDGATATGVVLQPSTVNPSRAQVTWTIA